MNTKEEQQTISCLGCATARTLKLEGTHGLLEASPSLLTRTPNNMCHFSGVTQETRAHHHSKVGDETIHTLSAQKEKCKLRTRMGHMYPSNHSNLRSTPFIIAMSNFTTSD